MPIIEAKIPSLVIRVQGDLAIPLRFAWEGGPEAVISEKTGEITKNLTISNDNDVVAKMTVTAVNASNDMGELDIPDVTEIPAEGNVTRVVKITFKTDKKHGDTVTFSFQAVGETTEEGQ